MMLQGPRSEFEKALGKALSRYIGYTTAAYDLDRIFGILSEFADKPSAYELEIVSSMRQSTVDEQQVEKGKLKEEYLAETIHFATSFNIIELVSDRGAKIKRYAPTQTGRSIMGAKALGDTDFFHFYRTKIVLNADADAIVPALKFSQYPVAAKSRFAEYTRFHRELRERRWRWLEDAFPDGRLRTRIVDLLPWLKRKGRMGGGVSIERISTNTARHHTTPRSKWLTQLGLAETLGGRLTPWGDAVLQALVTDGDYFWLGPAKGVQEALRIPNEWKRGGATEDDIQFTRSPCAPSAATLEQVIESTAQMMIKGYQDARLVYAPQAPLELPIEFIAYRSYKEGVAYSWQDILSKVFMRYRSRMERLSARRGPVGFYKVRDAKQ